MNRTPSSPLALAVLLLAACGGDGDGAASPDAEARTIEVVMVDNAFDPATVEVEAGETVRFVFTNAGEAVHEAYIGDATAQQEHDEEMAEMGGMEGDMGGMEGDMDGMDHDHDDADGVSVEPGGTAEVTHTFGDAGEVQIGCHQPGHYEDGMVLVVDVT